MVSRCHSTCSMGTDFASLSVSCRLLTLVYRRPSKGLFNTEFERILDLAHIDLKEELCKLIIYMTNSFTINVNLASQYLSISKKRFPKKGDLCFKLKQIIEHNLSNISNTKDSVS